MAGRAAVVVAGAPGEIPAAPVGGKITAVYWNICGLGQPIRYALELAGADYVDVRVDPGPGAPGTAGYKRTWLDKKPELEKTMLFTNLPYLLDGDIALVQSNAILRYLGRKFDLMGDPGSMHLVDLVLEQAVDFDNESTGRCYSDFASMKPYCEEALPGKLEQWARLLGAKPYMTGEHVTVADLKVYETLRKLRIIEEQLGTQTLQRFPTLLAFLGRIEALPPLQAYFKSPAFLARPLNNPQAQFM